MPIDEKEVCAEQKDYDAPLVCLDVQLQHEVTGFRCRLIVHGVLEFERGTVSLRHRYLSNGKNEL